MPMRIPGWIAAFLFAVLPCSSQTTLREQLQSAGIPQDRFSSAQLNEVVDGSEATNHQFVYYVYLRENGGLLTGSPQAIRYDTRSGALLRAEVTPDNKELCCGSPDGIEFVGSYALVSFHDNPSAGTVLVLNSRLELVETLYGFGIIPVAADQIVFTENMMHFAPVHPDRLQWVDLRTEAALEIYPLKNDPLRDRFIREQAQKMPEACKLPDNELCNYGEFDEGCLFLGGDGAGRLAFACGRAAYYQGTAEKEPVAYTTDDAVYLYAHGAKGWSYCEQAITPDDAKKLDRIGKNAYENIRSRCTPNQAVMPDESTNDLSPFPALSLHKK